VPDIFAQTQSGLDSPAQGVFDVTTNDSTDLAIFTRAIWVGTGGNICVSDCQALDLPGRGSRQLNAPRWCSETQGTGGIWPL
jgi:hypothetical protein